MVAHGLGRRDVIVVKALGLTDREAAPRPWRTKKRKNTPACASD
jgi:hypothetical protein